MVEKTQKIHQEEINGLDYVIVILKHKEFLIKATLLSFVVSLVIAFLIPPVYLAETRILPPQTAASSMASVFSTQMGAIGLSPTGLGVKTPNDLYLALLKTKPVAEFVINRCGLLTYYGTNSLDSVRQTLFNNLVARDDKKSGILTIGYKAGSPEKAADIANAFVAGLQTLNNTLAVTEAGQRRLFFEEQLKISKERLIASEEALKSFQQRTGTIKIDDEAKAAIGSASELRAKISAKEVQMRIMRTYATPENPDLLKLQSEIEALRVELQRMESKADSVNDSLRSVGRISSLETEYLRRMREFKHAEAMYEVFVKQYSAAKIDESRDAGIVQIIELADAPLGRHSPSRRRIVLLSTVLTFLCAIGISFLRNYWDNLNRYAQFAQNYKDLGQYLNFSALANDLKIDLLINKLKALRKQ